jgi:hypothetical protein
LLAACRGPRWDACDASFGTRAYESMWGLPHLLNLVICRDQHDINRRKNCIVRVTGGKDASNVHQLSK